jgi:peptidyl-prolyl cis-trans isomerase B (cyclophilin B)
MKTPLIVSFALLMILVGCSKTEKTPAPASTTKTEEPKKESTMASSNLSKWPGDYPIDGDSVAVITVEQEGVGKLGEIVLEFYPNKAPNHVRNFKWLANNKFYDGVVFHRVIKDFMIQGGDPTGTGMGGPNWTVEAEFNDTPHTKGILSMARSSDPNSAGSQFFICHGNPSHLNGQYTAFGNTIKGLDVVDKIATTEVQGSKPAKTVKMTSVRIVPRSSVM